MINWSCIHVLHASAINLKKNNNYINIIVTYYTQELEP